MYRGLPSSPSVGKNVIRTNPQFKMVHMHFKENTLALMGVRSYNFIFLLYKCWVLLRHDSVQPVVVEQLSLSWTY